MHFMFPDDDGYPAGFDIQQVCLNGHIITNLAKSSPEETSKFCTKCGAETITKCQRCAAQLRGIDHDSNVVMCFYEPPPSYCYNCGKAHPWTERHLEAAAELVAEDDSLDEQDKGSLTDTFQHLTSDTPKTPTAILRFKKLASKAGSELGEGLHKILVDVVSESVKKAIWGPHA